MKWLLVGVLLPLQAQRDYANDTPADDAWLIGITPVVT